MQNDLKQHHLAFLISLGAMPMLGCPADDDSDTGNSTQTQTTEPTTSVSTTDNSTSDTDPSTTNSTTNSTQTQTTDNSTSADTGETGTTDPTADSGTTGEVPAECQAYADHYAKCFPRYGSEYAAMYCSYALGGAAKYGTECPAAYEDYFSCLTGLDCATLTDKTPDCEAESMAIDTACNFGGSSSSGSSGG